MIRLDYPRLTLVIALVLGSAWNATIIKR